jgi:hypothetical protein
MNLLVNFSYKLSVSSCSDSSLKEKSERLPGASLVSWRVLAGLRSATVELHREKIHAAYNLKAGESDGLQQEALFQKARFADMNGKSRVVSRSQRTPNHSHRRVSTSANAPCRQKQLG